jgi:hypothetical protein
VNPVSPAGSPHQRTPVQPRVPLEFRYGSSGPLQFSIGMVCGPDDRMRIPDVLLVINAAPERVDLPLAQDPELRRAQHDGIVRLGREHPSDEQIFECL